MPCGISAHAIMGYHAVAVTPCMQADAVAYGILKLVFEGGTLIRNGAFTNAQASDGLSPALRWYGTE